MDIHGGHEFWISKIAMNIHVQFSTNGKSLIHMDIHDPALDIHVLYFSCPVDIHVQLPEEHMDIHINAWISKCTSMKGSLEFPNIAF